MKSIEKNLNLRITPCISWKNQDTVMNVSLLKECPEVFGHLYEI